MRYLLLLVIALIMCLAVAANAKPVVPTGQFGPGMCADSDGDGIPNCEDPDWVPPADGSGYQWGRPILSEFFMFMNLTPGGQGNGPKYGPAYGPGDGTGDGTRPEDGTGYGPGDCQLN